MIFSLINAHPFGIECGLQQKSIQFAAWKSSEIYCINSLHAMDISTDCLKNMAFIMSSTFHITKVRCGNISNQNSVQGFTIHSKKKEDTE